MATLKISGVLIRLSSVLDNISEWTGKIFSWFIIPVVLLMVFEVLTRYIFRAPTIWSYEVIIMFYGFHFIILIGYALLHGAHVSINALSVHWPPRAQAIVYITLWLVFFVPFSLLLVVKGTQFAANSWSMLEVSNTLFHPPLYPIKTIVPLAGFLFLLQGLSEFIKKLLFAIRVGER